MKKIFFKRHKNKLIALFIFCTGTLWFANYIGYQHIPGHVRHVWQDHIMRDFVKDQSQSNLEEVQDLSSALQVDYQDPGRTIDGIGGDFEGTGSVVYAFISPNDGYIYFSKGKGLPIVDFMNVDPNELKLFEEGDLDNDGADDFSVYRYKKGLLNEIYTYVHSANGLWTKCLIIDLNSNEKASEEDVKARVFRKNDNIYFLDKVKDEKSNEYKLVSKSLNSFKAEQSGIGIMVK